MSTNLKYKQVVNVKRRTWDLDVYDQLAKEEAQQQDSGKIIKKKKRKHEKEGQSLPLPTLGPQGTDDNGEEQKEEFQRAAKGAAGPAKSERAFLKARRQRVDVDSKIGSVEMIHPDAAATTKANAGDEGGSVKNGVTKTGVGWHCKVCDCFLRDSHTYLDHINGKKHQRNLGYSMRVERSTKEQVSSRLARLAKEKDAVRETNEFAEEDVFQSLVEAKDEAAQQKKKERARQRKERRQQKKLERSIQQPSHNESASFKQLDSTNEDVDTLQEIAENEEGGNEEPEVNPDLAAMMGFSGFGGGNKNR